MSTTTKKNPTPAEVRKLLLGGEIEQTTYLVGRTETVFAMLRLDDEGYPQDWLGIVRETEISAFTECYRSRGDRVEFVPLNIELPNLNDRDIPSRLSMNALATKSHATLSLLDDCDDDTPVTEPLDDSISIIHAAYRIAAESQILGFTAMILDPHKQFSQKEAAICGCKLDDVFVSQQSLRDASRSARKAVKSGHPFAIIVVNEDEQEAVK